MSFSRRQLLRNLGVLGAVAVTPLSASCSSQDEPEEDSPFKHGVASGDPLTDAVILWTRVTTDAPVEVTWEVSKSPDFAAIERSGTVTANADRDFTVKVDANRLAAGTTYYYRFHALSKTSPIGRTKTAPSGSLSRLRLGLVSCSSLAHGYFHAYRHLAGRLDLDAIVHLGDYIYEYGDGQYGEVRKYEPPHEIVTLADYRMRYAQYRRDPDLQALHRQFPFINVWDDHESANNSFANGAENHNPEDGEGEWQARRAAAGRAYSEWIPIRDQEGGIIYRSFTFGDLAELLMLDTRIEGRDAQADGKSDPTLNDEKRQMLGAAQETWLATRLLSSTAKWQLLGQQVMVAPFEGLFFNDDAWDGYPAARERLFKLIEVTPTKNVVVLTGDIHMSFACEVPRNSKSPDYDPATGKGSLCVEMVVPGVSSPGLPEKLANVAQGLLQDNPHLKFADVTKRGYVVLDVTPERVQGAWYHYTALEEREATPEFASAWAVRAGSKQLVSEVEAAPAGNAPAAAP